MESPNLHNEQTRRRRPTDEDHLDAILASLLVLAALTACARAFATLMTGDAVPGRHRW